MSTTMTLAPPDSFESVPAGPGETVALRRLTRSERRVLALLVCGSAPKQAAWELDVSVATVRSHLASAKRKSGARTLHQLIGMFVAANSVQM